MLFGHIIRHLTPIQCSTIRKIERVSKKIVNAEAAVKFNNICLKEDLLPKYSNIRLHDEAASDAPETRRFRRNLVERQLQSKTEELVSLQSTLNTHQEEWTSLGVPQDLRTRVEALLKDELNQHYRITNERTQRKLIKLNGGNFKMPNTSPGYINLTDKTLTEDQEELLNLGLNCHVLSRPRPYQKRIEIEALMMDLHTLAANRKVLLDDGIREELLREARIQRGKHTSRILKRRHKDAAKQLREDPSITIRKADKASSYVLMHTDEYNQKIHTILSDQTKFKKITRNPTEALKTKINKIIDAVNSMQGDIKLKKLSGDYTPGYCYGTVKTHKRNNPLRPIISQIPTPTYHLAKTLNTLLTPFIPKDYSIESTADFLTILNGTSPEGIIASLDVESLFTNVPVDRTINYIIKEIYPDNSPAKLKIPKNLLLQLLEVCTKEAPFISPDGKMYQQIDGVAMGSPLGVLFANFFMGMVEREAFASVKKPNIYTRYVDDIFVLIKDQEELNNLKNTLQHISGLNFTTENNVSGKLPFLDILVEAGPTGFSTDVYTKPTNPGLCLNGNSECPQRYRLSTINAYVRRALTHCSSWTRTHTELDRVTQVLVNNGYSNKEVQMAINKQVDKWYSPTQPETQGNKIQLYYRNIFSSQYRADEDALKKIINRCVQPTEDNSRINLTIYYKSLKTSQLLIKNNPIKNDSDLQRSHLVYHYTCKRGNCEALNNTYIGMTTTKLSRRLTCHLSNGGIRQHHCNEHQSPPTRKDLEEGTTILQKEADSRRLQILEALYIKDRNPTMNTQTPNCFTLPTSKIIEHKYRTHVDPSGNFH